MTTGVLARYYDRLARWNRIAQLFGYGGGRSTLTVHRGLADPAAHGRPTFTRIHDILFAELADTTPRRMLDAGCGLGGTMLACVERFREIAATGLTLSTSQAQQANSAAAARRLDGRVQALVRSFDDPPRGPFDLIIAIESLAHSNDPAASVTALAGVLATGGRFVIVDDMPEPDAGSSADLIVFKTGWNCPVLAGSATYRAALTRGGLTVLEEHDLTPECRPRSAGRTAMLMMANRVARRLLPSPAVRQVLDAHLGGLALERLLRTGAVRYRMIVARRPDTTGIRVS
jgi:SAM-dependent methyltransferase